MGKANMRVRAVIFDIYNTLLEVGPPPTDAESRWQRLFKDLLAISPPLNRVEFSVRAGQVIARRHAEARARGIQWPEIVWPSVVLEVLPALVQLPAQQLDEFVLGQMQIGRTLRLAAHVADSLGRMKDKGMLLGTASNSQAYTLFDPELRFWSFEHGFSKPDPHVFQILTARLEARGIRPAEILMVGDRLDNDIEPARAHGWRTWHLTATDKGNAKDSGGFRELCAALGCSRNISSV
jgi:FMN phosphatase YigB (HAD superfamily)